MNKKQLAEGVEEGILGAFNKLLIILIMVLGGFTVGYFILDTIIKDCHETGECVVASPSCFPLKNLNCRILVGNETIEEYTWHFSVCGYQEANALFEQLKPKINEDIEKLKEIGELDGNWEIKYLDCY